MGTRPNRGLTEVPTSGAGSGSFIEDVPTLHMYGVEEEEEEEEEQTTEPTTVEVPAEPLVALPVSDAHVVVEVADACPHIHLAWLHRWPSNHVQEVIYFGDYQAGDMETST